MCTSREGGASEHGLDILVFFIRLIGSINDSVRHCCYCEMGVDQEDFIFCIRFNLCNERFFKGMIEFGVIKPNEFCRLPNLLEVGEPTKSGYPFTLVQLACVYKRDEVYTELLNHGGLPIEISEDQLRNALCYSAMYNQPDLTFALLNFRAFDINVPGSDFSHNPLQLCFMHDSPAVVQILIEDGRLDLV